MDALTALASSRAAQSACLQRCTHAGINLERMSKILKCAGSDDVVTLSAQDDNDRITFVFESPSMSPSPRCIIEPEHPCLETRLLKYGLFLCSIDS